MRQPALNLPQICTISGAAARAAARAYAPPDVRVATARQRAGLTKPLGALVLWIEADQEHVRDTGTGERSLSEIHTVLEGPRD